MSKKKTEKMMAYKPKFIEGLTNHGAKESDAETFWNELVEFSKYAFNKSHACAYAITAYYTAWLKYYYPKEYLTAVLNNSKFEDFGKVMADAKIFGIKVVKPSVQESAADFTSDPERPRILFGLSKIKQVATSADKVLYAREGLVSEPFKDFEDLVNRTELSKSVLENLIISGACDCLNKDMPRISEWRKALLGELGNFEFNTDETIPLLIAEKNLTGGFLTSNPVREYSARDQISDISINKNIYEIVGIITDYNPMITKAGKKMARFTVTDNSGTIKAICFPTAYEKIADMIDEDKILKLTVKANISDDENAEREVFVDSVQPAIKKTEKVLIKSDKDHSYDEIMTVLKMHEDKNGIPVFIDDEDTGIRAYPSIYKDRALKTVIIPM